MPRIPPASPGTGSGVAGLIAYYEEHGESEHVAIIEHALTADWAPTKDIAAKTQKSQSYVRRVLEYLAIKGRAERREGTFKTRGFTGTRVRLEWRTNQSQSFPK